MSSFLNLTPVLRVAIENPFLKRSYPITGSVIATIDTGYEGFVVVPEDVFHELGLEQLKTEKRILRLADGSDLDSYGAFGSLKITGQEDRIDGFIETYRGLEEIIVGVEAFSNYKLLLNYCIMRLEIQKCP